MSSTTPSVSAWRKIHQLVSSYSVRVQAHSNLTYPSSQHSQNQSRRLEASEWGWVSTYTFLEFWLTYYLGDDNRVIVWDLTRGIELQTISVLFHGPVSASAWTPTSLNPVKAFAFGCADGTLAVHSQVLAKVSLWHFCTPPFTDPRISLITISRPPFPPIPDQSKISISILKRNTLQPSGADAWNCGQLTWMVAVSFFNARCSY